MITGASGGFGKIWVKAFLKRGDFVVAVTRNVDALDDVVKIYGAAILPLKADVNNSSECFKAVQQAKAHFGRIDVLINNAGYTLMGAIEETTEKQARDQFDANLFGLLWMTQAVLPVMRTQGSGHIIQMSSLLGIISSPITGLYTASKWAVEGLSESLASEVGHLGIKVTILEPNGYATGADASAVHSGSIPSYQSIKAVVYDQFTSQSFGRPEATARAVLQLTDMPKPPLRLFLGKAGLPAAQQVYAQRLQTWQDWNQTAIDAHGE